MKLFLATILRNGGVPELNLDFFSKGSFMQLNAFSLKSGVCEMLEGKDHRAVDKVFPIIDAYINGATGFQNDANMIGFHRMYFNTEFKVVLQNNGRGWFVTELENCAEAFVRSNIRL